MLGRSSGCPINVQANCVSAAESSTHGVPPRMGCIGALGVRPEIYPHDASGQSKRSSSAQSHVSVIDRVIVKNERVCIAAAESPSGTQRTSTKAGNLLIPRLTAVHAAADAADDVATQTTTCCYGSCRGEDGSENRSRAACEKARNVEADTDKRGPPAFARRVGIAQWIVADVGVPVPGLGDRSDLPLRSPDRRSGTFPVLRSCAGR